MEVKEEILRTFNLELEGHEVKYMIRGGLLRCTLSDGLKLNIRIDHPGIHELQKLRQFIIDDDNALESVINHATIAQPLMKHGQAIHED